MALLEEGMQGIIKAVPVRNPIVRRSIASVSRVRSNVVIFVSVKIATIQMVVRGQITQNKLHPVRNPARNLS